MVNAFEERKMEIFDAPGPYLNANIPEEKFVWLKLEEEFVYIIREVNP